MKGVVWYYPMVYIIPTESWGLNASVVAEVKTTKQTDKYRCVNKRRHGTLLVRVAVMDLQKRFWRHFDLQHKFSGYLMGRCLFETSFRPRRGPALISIPEGCCWMESDNPRNSKDSNFYGPVSCLMFNQSGPVIDCYSWDLTKVETHKNYSVMN